MSCIGRDLAERERRFRFICLGRNGVLYASLHLHTQTLLFSTRNPPAGLLSGIFGPGEYSLPGDLQYGKLENPITRSRNIENVLKKPKFPISCAS